MAGPLSVFILRLANRINVDLKRDTILEEETWNKGWMDFFLKCSRFFRAIVKWMKDYGKGRIKR